jgi:uncharacterized protein with GYD domain
MATFFMFGKYSQEALKGISAGRTEEAKNLIRGLGGEIKNIYALLGEYDLVLITEFSGIEEAMKASVAITKMTGISFSTAPAISVGRFDELMKK